MTYSSIQLRNPRCRRRRYYVDNHNDIARSYYTHQVVRRPKQSDMSTRYPQKQYLKVGRTLFIASLMLLICSATSSSTSDTWWLSKLNPNAFINGRDHGQEILLTQRQEDIPRQEVPNQQGKQQRRRRRRRLETNTNNQDLVYYDNPQLHWKIRLDPPNGLDQGNAVVPSPYDDKLLYVTTSSGNLFALSAVDGKTLWSYRPPVKSMHNGGEVWTTTCGSSVVFGDVESVGKFLVYAIVDYPPGGTVYGPQSRLVAISIPDHEQLWLSTDLPGVVQGTPVINTNQNDQSRQFILISRNSQLLKNDNTTQTTGHITMLQSDTGQVVWTESEGMRASATNPQGYGPLTVTTSPTFGKYDGGWENANDLVLWTSSGREGRSKNGFTYAFQLPPFYHSSSEQVNALASVQLKDVRWSAVARPTLTANGQQLFVAVTGSQLRGWTGSNAFDKTADWSAELALNGMDPTTAIPVAPILSRDESRLFVPSASTQMACIDSQKGTTLWEMMGNSRFLAEPKVSPDDDRVYFIQSGDGLVYSVEQEGGAVLWATTCDQFEEDCANAVLSESALSRDGKYFYYGDVMGRVIALELGSFEAPGPAPTGSSPTNIYPLDPSNWPPMINDEANGSRSSVKKGPTLGGSIALIVLATLVGSGASIYIIFANNMKTHPHPMQEPHLDDPVIQNDLGLPPTDLAIVPDPYEDEIILKHAADTAKHFPDEYGGNYYYYGEGHGMRDADEFDNFSHAPADRISRRLGTSNLIQLPRPEDYSYGASVLV